MEEPLQQPGILPTHSGNRKNLVIFGILALFLIVIISGAWFYLFVFNRPELQKEVTQAGEKAQPKELESDRDILPDINLETVLLATIPEDYSVVPYSTVFSSNGRSVVYAAEKLGKQFVVFNNKPGKTYSQVFGKSRSDKIIFSPNGKRMAYWAVEEGNYDGKPFVVLDGQEGKRYDAVFDLTFSSNSQSLAYRARDERGWFVVVDGEESKAYKKSFIHDQVDNLIFSPDSQKIAYVVTHEDGKQSIVINGKEGEAYDGISTRLESRPRFSWDSQKIIYVAEQDGKQFVVVNTNAGKAYEQTERDGMRMPIIDGLTFAPNTGQTAYRVTSKEEAFVVVDDREEKIYDAVGPPMWSKDGQKIGYWAEKDGKTLSVINGKESELEFYYYGIFGPYFSFEGERIAYWVIKENGEQAMVIDGEEGPAYDQLLVTVPVFSPNSQRTAYWARRGERQFIVVDGQEWKSYESISSPIFSPDSQKVAYGVSEARKQVIVVDDKRIGSYDGIDQPFFSDDSRYIIYGAKIGQQLWWVVEPVE